MKKYYNRVADDILLKKLRGKGAVLITGAKWCGKTTTASKVSKSVLYMQDPQFREQNLQMVDLDPSRLLQGETPRLIDEWQLAPKLWDAIRFEIDKRDEFAQFVLTGSAVPADFSKISHSGIGRIARLRMRPMSLYESGDSNGMVSLENLFTNNAYNLVGENNASIDKLAFWICRGGWPRAINCDKEIALQQAFDYFDGIIESDVSRADNINRDPQRVKNLMRSYARFIGSQAKIPTILADVKTNERDTLSADTISSYIKALNQIYVIEDSPAWNPNLRSKTAIRTSDTRYFTDPSIGVAALGIEPDDLINDLETMGLFFENLCIRDLRVYAEALDGSVYHYRDRSDLECDCVIHLRNGSYGLIEIKLGGDKLISEGVETLNTVAENIDTSRMKHPSFKMIVTGIGKYAYEHPDGVLVVPIGCLKQ